MKTLDTKKIIIIFSVLIAIVLTAVLLAITTGNVRVPSLSDPNGVFYQRTDGDGNVIYTLTNEEVFQQIKANDGMNQLMLMSDQVLLSDYINQVTEQEVLDKIKQLKYGTSDNDKIAELDAATVKTDEDNYNQAMILAGYENNEAAYAKILVAREKYSVEAIKNSDQVTPNDVAEAFINNYFEDINAIKIRFTSSADALNVMHKFNLVSVDNGNLGLYNGFVYQQENLKDLSDNVVQAYQTITVYYYDTDQNILDLNGNIIYTKGASDVYTDANDNEFHVNPSGNLVDSHLNVIIENANLLDSKTAAQTYKDSNTTYYTVSRTDPFDMNETINVLDNSQNVVFTIDPANGHIYDASSTDVTDTTTLYVNKQYKNIDDVDNFTVNDTTTLTDQEILDIYINMYNYVYGEYRTELPVNSTASDLMGLDNSNLQFNFDDVKTYNSDLATYMFNTLSKLNDTYYSTAPQNIASANDNDYYLVYKLSSPEKTDIVTQAFDYLEPLIVLPAQVGGDIELPSSSFYNSTITWLSSNVDVIDKTGAFTRPDQDTNVEMTYNLTVFGVSTSGKIIVKALASGDTSAVTTPTWTEVPVQDLINDSNIYTTVYNNLVDDMVYGSNAKTNITTQLVDLRNTLGFKINDSYLAYDYQSTDSNYAFSGKGDKTVLASFEKTLTSDQPLLITADDLFKFAIAKNPALYTIYASQFKELLYSDYYTEIFGDQTNIKKNHSTRMTDMYTAVTNTKNYYVYLQNLYSQYGMAFNYDNFQQYAYKTYGTKSDYELLKHFITGELQPYLVDKTLTQYDVLNKIYPTVEEYYNNYFSLNVTHVLIYLDFNEDGTPDSYNDYVDSLNQTDKDAFNAKIATLEENINNYSGTFDGLVTAYNDASRDDPTWGQFKQMGLQILTQSLNVQDSKDKTVYHSLTYTGDYGVKDTYAPEFVSALVDLYDQYQLPQNINADSMDSEGLVVTDFGLHKIQVTKGDDFDRPSAAFTETDANNPQYSVGSENPNDMPTMDQVNLYAEYKFYSLVYDLSDTEVEQKYNIVVPKLPASVSSALDVYVGTILNRFYVIGTVNVSMSNNLVNGEFTINSDYSNLTNTEVMAMLDTVKGVYYHSMFDSYFTDTTN